MDCNMWQSERFVYYESNYKHNECKLHRKVFKSFICATYHMCCISAYICCIYGLCINVCMCFDCVKVQKCKGKTFDVKLILKDYRRDKVHRFDASCSPCVNLSYNLQFDICVQYRDIFGNSILPTDLFLCDAATITHLSYQSFFYFECSVLQLSVI